MGRIAKLPVAAVWMTAAAYAVGHGPAVAGPLGHAYAYSMLRRRRADGYDLPFGGMTFDEPREGVIAIPGPTVQVFNRKRYTDEVHARFRGADHDRLVHRANDVLELENVEALDETRCAWDLLTAALRTTGLNVEALIKWADRRAA